MDLCVTKILVTSYSRLVPVKYGACNGLTAGAVLGLVPKCLVSFWKVGLGALEVESKASLEPLSCP